MKPQKMNVWLNIAVKSHPPSCHTEASRAMAAFIRLLRPSPPCIHINICTLIHFNSSTDCRLGVHLKPILVLEKVLLRYADG